MHIQTTDAIRDALKKYGIEQFKADKISEGIENNNLMITSGSEQYVLRIYRKKNIQQVYAELDFVDALEKDKIPLPKVILDINRKKVGEISGKCAVLFSFVDGNHPSKNMSSNLAKNIGINLAKLHLASLKYSRMHNKSELTPAIDKIIHYETEDSNLRKIILPYSLKIKDLKRDLLNHSFIHSDITRENLIVREDSLVAIVDFDDFHKDFIIWDVAVALTHLFITKTNGIHWTGIEAFLKGYFSKMHITQYELDQLIFFMKLRNVELAILMDDLKNTRKNDINEILSIQESALYKISIIKENETRISKLIKLTFN